jgi:inosose dehydratase
MTSTMTQVSGAPAPPAPRVKVGSAPAAFGIDEIVIEDAWMPEPEAVLDWIVELDYAGTELGPPGYLAPDAATLRDRLERRGLELVGSFLPQHFSRDEKADDDRAWLRTTLRMIRDGSPEGSRPFAILADHFDEPERTRWSGRIAEHPEAWLSPARFESLIANLHRAGELCREEGFEAVLHPHAGTYIETRDEIARVMDRLDPSLVGLCLDTGHFRYGGADPAESIDTWHELLRHVHLKDCRTSIMDGVIAEGRDLHEALVRGVFCPLGEGDSGMDAVVEALRRHAYEGWVIVEQDQFLRAEDTPETLVAGQRRNREYLRRYGM